MPSLLDSLTHSTRTLSRLPLALARIRIPSAMLVFIAVASQVVANELNSLIDEVLASNGHVYSLGNVLGWGAATQLDNWAQWSTAAVSPVPFIVGNTIADLAFIFCYAILASRLIGVGFARWQGDHPDFAAARPTVPADLLLLLVAADLAEDVIILILSALLAASGGHPLTFGGLPGVLAGVTYLKLLALVLFLGYAVLSDRIGSTVRATVPRVLRALYAQRLVVLVIAAIGIMSLVSAPDLLAQISDIYRSLFTFTTATPPGVPTVDIRVVSVLVGDVLTGLVIYAVSRERVRHYASVGNVDNRERAHIRGWFIAAAAIAVPGAIFAAASHWHLVDAFPFFTMVGAVLFIAVSSLVLRLLHVPMLPTFGRAQLSTGAGDVELAGNIVVAVWVAICFFGPFKALVSPLFLSATGAFGDTSPYRFSAPFLLGFEIVLLAGGVIVAGLVWRRLRTGAPVAAREARPDPAGLRRAALRVRDGAVHLASSVSSTDPETSRDPRLIAFNWWMFGISAFLLLFSLVFPGIAGLGLGPLGAFVLLLGSWTAVLGTLIRILGVQKPLEIFALVRLRATPIVTLLIVVPLLISLIDSVPGLHALRFAATPSATANPAGTGRPKLSDAFSSWMDDPAQSTCSAPITTADGSTVHVRPLLLVAAQGGGIRAATWTVDVLDQLAAEGTCADDSTLLSSGASGGSIGLATFHDAHRSASEQAKNSTTPFAGQNALGTVIVALVDGDLLGGMTGIRVPSATNPTDLTGAWDWHDRTALQELAWQREIPAFNQAFNSTPVGPTGYLVLNSTDSVTDCKVLVAQVDLGTTSTSAVPDCNGSGVNLSNTIDLSDTLGPCFGNLEFSTAAELSARFPVISPPGRIDKSTVPANCNQGLAAMQLVDGGTTDNSAIGTLADVAPSLTGLISKANAGQDGSKSAPFIVPVLVYASNYPGLDLTATAAHIKPDALVPLNVLSAAQAAEATPAAWLTRASSAYAQVCTGYSAKHASGSDGSACSDALAALRTAIPRGVVVVSPSTSPAVSVPLGWTLSGFSEAQLKLQAEQQAKCVPSQAAKDATTCRVYEGYGTYGSLLKLFSDEK